MSLETSASALLRAQWQRTIFAERPRRHELLALSGDVPLKPVRLYVHRNQPFEFVAAALAPFLAYAGYSAEIDYSPYDDALSAPARATADVEIVWLDYSRYSGEIAAWLPERLRAIRSGTQAPILIAGDPRGAFDAQAAADAVPGVHLCDLAALAREFGPDFFDRRMEGVAATPISGAASLEIARRFGLVWLPAALGLRVKAIVADLDNTLYAGVLGEDGVQGVRLDPAHAALQRALVECRERGILLTLASRNEPADAEDLFRARADFPLRREHFSAVRVGWRRKSESVREIARALHIGTDAILFLDDNAGELAEVAAELPGIRTLDAARPDEVERALLLYPGLSGWRLTEADAVRAADLAAEGERSRLLETAADPTAYLRSLSARLTFAYNPASHAARLYELSTKTNQFNTALLRLSEAEVARRLADPQCATVTVALSDRLSDSGIVAALFCRWEGATLVAEEIDISCRALGRQLETVMIAEALRGMRARVADAGGAVECRFRAGPRNGPAREWLRSVSSADPEDGGRVRVPWPSLAAALASAAGFLTIEWMEA